MAERMRIDELAARTATSTRNIRAYQTAGLLPPPELEGRTGWYGREHVQRLEMIGELQERGFSLAAIRHTLDAWAAGGTLGHLVGLRQILRAPMEPEQPGRISSEELYSRFPEARDDAALVGRAVALGLVARRGDGNDFDVPSPLLVEAGAELVGLGIPLAEVLDAVDDVRSLLGAVADRFVALVAPTISGRLLGEDATEEGAVEALAAVQRLRPIALEVVRPFLAAELERAIEAGLSAATASLPTADAADAG